MTIAVDLVLATRPNASTGIERYAINLFEALRRIAPEAIAFVDSRAAVPTGPGVVRVPGAFAAGLPCRSAAPGARRGSSRWYAPPFRPARCCWPRASRSSGSSTMISRGRAERR
ncbi:hypothetical protein ACFS32_20455 [Novosphingobium pokkalii]|uniref:hypothetical protein n=1 Tax=Novosphingobium pokkalii TaxID=1770194 RepID=UPI0036425242